MGNKQNRICRRKRPNPNFRRKPRDKEMSTLSSTNNNVTTEEPTVIDMVSIL